MDHSVPAVEEELKRVFLAYALGEPRGYERTASGFVNANWIVETDRGRYFLKRRHPSLNRPHVIRSQHELISFLQSQGFPTPRLVPTTQGESLLLLGGSCYEVQEFIAAGPYEHGRLAHLVEAAAVLGRYHTSAAGFAPQALLELESLYSPAVVRHHVENIREFWRVKGSLARGHVVDRLAEHASELANRFAAHHSLPHLVIHGDYYADNLLFDGDRIVGVVDYDKASWQPRVAELAEALIYFSSPRPGVLKRLAYPGVLDWDPFAHFLRAYLRVVSLEENEVAALPDYVRCIWMQMSLQRPLQGLLPAGDLDALRELLILADWARDNASRMVEEAL